MPLDTGLCILWISGAGSLCERARAGHAVPHPPVCLVFLHLLSM